MEKLTLSTLNHTAKLLKCQRFTFGQHLDKEMLNVVELIAEALFSSGKERVAILRKVKLSLEKLRVLWRIVLAKEWLSASQALFVHEKINEIGRMAGNWMKDTATGPVDCLPGAGRNQITQSVARVAAAQPGRDHG